MPYYICNDRPSRICACMRCFPHWDGIDIKFVKDKECIFLLQPLKTLFMYINTAYIMTSGDLVTQ